MNRWEFMRQLEELLLDISPSEREEALQYYNDYFNDAGRENEAEVIEALGTPEQVAKTVKEGLGFVQVEGKDEKEEQTSEQKIEQDSEQTYGQSTESENDEKWPAKIKKQAKDLPTWAIVLIICAIVICFPVIFGVLGSLLGTVFGILMGIIGIAIGITVTAVALIVAAIALVIAGVTTVFVYPFTGIALLGAGFVCGGIGILFMILTVLLFGKGIPAICNGIQYLWKKYIKKEVVA